MSDNRISENQSTAEFSFRGYPWRVITRQREGQYLQNGELELGDHSMVWERTFDEQGQPLEWKFFEDSILTSVSEYRYEEDECIVTERDASGKVIEVTKQKPFSVTVQGSEQRISLPDSWPVSGAGLVASFKNEFDFDSKGNWIKRTTMAPRFFFEVQDSAVVYPTHSPNRAVV